MPTAFSSRMDQLTIGNCAFASLDALAFDANGLCTKHSRKIDGILGYSFPSNKVVLIDYPGKTIMVLVIASNRHNKHNGGLNIDVRLTAASFIGLDSSLLQDIWKTNVPRLPFDGLCYQPLGIQSPFSKLHFRLRGLLQKNRLSNLSR